jgi:hypothetical protein
VPDRVAQRSPFPCRLARSRQRPAAVGAVPITLLILGSAPGGGKLPDRDSPPQVS